LQQTNLVVTTAENKHHCLADVTTEDDETPAKLPRLEHPNLDDDDEADRDKYHNEHSIAADDCSRSAESAI